MHLALYLFILLALTHCTKHQNLSPHAKTPQPPIEIPSKPNIIVILTDQERYAMHWPEEWAEQHLPSMTRLKKHGLTFEHAYTSAAECSPSRAVMVTSEYFPINQMPHTPPEPPLPTMQQLIDIGGFLEKEAGYEVIWKGKWHLSLSEEGGDDWSLDDIINLEKNYGLGNWNPPDAGNAIEKGAPLPKNGMFRGLTTLGGGFANNDGRFVKGVSPDQRLQTQGLGESALSCLNRIARTPKEKRKPFCLFISLVNPHDVWVYPTCFKEAGYRKESFEEIGIELPVNFTDDLKTKPSIQLKARNAYNALSPLPTIETQREYVNFYAYLQSEVDSHIETILGALDASGLTDNTLIIRTSDHGELGLSHGMRQKAYTAYEEMIHVPLVISNPKMYPTPKTTRSFYSHIDLFPTIAELAGVPSSKLPGKGMSQVPVLKDPNLTLQDSILFAYDDLFFLPESTPGGHIRAIREGDWMYALYYSKGGKNFEYEMYNLKNDPGQLINLLYEKPSDKMALEAKRLHNKLKEKIDRAGALPPEFPWPIAK